jgi:hypothetical protein
MQSRKEISVKVPVDRSEVQLRTPTESANIEFDALPM